MLLESFNIGSVEITWDYGGTPQILTPEFGGVSVNITSSEADVMRGGHGNTPVDQVTQGINATMTFNLSEPTKERLALFLGATLDVDEVHVKNVVGCSIRELSKAVMLKPLCNGVATTDMALWRYLPLVTPPKWRSAETFDDEGQIVYAAECQVFPDDNNDVYVIGQNTV